MVQVINTILFLTSKFYRQNNKRPQFVLLSNDAFISLIKEARINRAFSEQECRNYTFEGLQIFVSPSNDLKNFIDVA